MPFKSKAQIAKFGAMVHEGKMSQETFDQWMAETPDAHKLPQRIQTKDMKDPGKPLKATIGEHMRASYIRRRFGLA